MPGPARRAPRANLLRLWEILPARLGATPRLRMLSIDGGHDKPAAHDHERNLRSPNHVPIPAPIIHLAGIGK